MHAHKWRKAQKYGGSHFCEWVKRAMVCNVAYLHACTLGGCDCLCLCTACGGVLISKLVIHRGNRCTYKWLYVRVAVLCSFLCDAGFLKMLFKHSVAEQGSERTRNKSYNHNECNMWHGKYVHKQVGSHLFNHGRLHFFAKKYSY